METQNPRRDTFIPTVGAGLYTVATTIQGIVWYVVTITEAVVKGREYVEEGISCGHLGKVPELPFSS